MTYKVTTFVETAVLWAVMNDDMGEAVRLIDDMLPGERDAYAALLNRVQNLLPDYCAECDRRVDDHHALVTLVRDLGRPGRSMCQPCADKETGRG